MQVREKDERFQQRKLDTFLAPKQLPPDAQALPDAAEPMLTDMEVKSRHHYVLV